MPSRSSASPVSAPPEDPPAGHGKEPLTLGEYLLGLTCRMLVLFGFYVLSIGPMYWRWYSGKYVNGSRYIAAFYEPLWILCGKLPGLGEWVNAWVQLWQG